MTTPRSPEGEMVDIMDLDREIETLRVGGGGRSSDDGLSLLLELRDDVDQRAATLLGQRDIASAARPVSPATTSTRRRRRHRLAVIPVAGALVLASTGAAAALSGSPHAPLYPLHRLIFGAAPSSDRQLARDLAEAQKLLDQAAAEPYAARAGALSQARVVLVTARSLLPMATARTRFSLELSAAFSRLAALETPPTTGGISPLPTAPTPPAAEPPSGSEGPVASESANAESETSGVAPGAVESDAPESVTPSGGWTGQSPETETSHATSPVRSETDRPARSSSPSTETEPRDN